MESVKKPRAIYYSIFQDINLKMKNLVVISLLLLAHITRGQGINLLEQRIELRSKISNEFALKLADRKIAEGTRNTVVYYHAINLRMDIISKQKSLSKKYGLISQSMSQAKRYQRLRIRDSSGMRLRQEALSRLATETTQLRQELTRQGKKAKAERLAAKMVKVRNSNLPKSKLVEDGSKDSLLRENRVEAGLFYGLPTGHEMVLSASIEKEKELVEILNKARRAKGLPELEWVEDLARAARYHAYDMATQRYFSHSSHDRINGKLVRIGGAFERMRMFYTESFINTENIAAGSKEAAGTYRQWYNSKGHYKNMFNSEATKVGLGFYYAPNTLYKYYWVFCTAK